MHDFEKRLHGRFAFVKVALALPSGDGEFWSDAAGGAKSGKGKYQIDGDL